MISSGIMYGYLDGYKFSDRSRLARCTSEMVAGYEFIHIYVQVKSNTNSSICIHEAKISEGRQHSVRLNYLTGLENLSGYLQKLFFADRIMPACGPLLLTNNLRRTQQNIVMYSGGEMYIFIIFLLNTRLGK